jgi:YidC/Oxa1 family membrane protein insertase
VSFVNQIIQPIVNLFKLALGFFFTYTHSWGWSIILLTVVIKMILFPTMIKQFRVMSKMKDIQPKLKAIQEKYKDKPDELQRRTMEVYKTEGVNPFGSCLPMLLQLPILWAIFQLLQDPKYISEVIKNASFLGFILKEKGYWILAIISGATTFLQQKLTTPSGNDPQQQVFLYMMPLMLGFFTYQVNAGVGLYWITSNVVGVLQQYLINEYFIVKEHIVKPDELPDPDKK